MCDNWQEPNIPKDISCLINRYYTWYFKLCSNTRSSPYFDLLYKTEWSEYFNRRSNLVQSINWVHILLICSLNTIMETKGRTAHSAVCHLKKPRVIWQLIRLGALSLPLPSDKQFLPPALVVEVIKMVLSVCVCVWPPKDALLGCKGRNMGTGGVQTDSWGAKLTRELLDVRSRRDVTSCYMSHRNK